MHFSGFAKCQPKIKQLNKSTNSKKYDLLNANPFCMFWEKEYFDINIFGFLLIKFRKDYR
jgi:hypothetical protein